jgi:outer membrane protein OmpA-like peptidoglycan-associated protein
VLFLDRPGTCRLVVIQASAVIQRLRTEVVLRGASASAVVAPQRTLTTRFLGDSAVLRARSKSDLRAAAPTLRRAGAVAVYGYSSSSRAGTSNAFANRLAAARARAVAAYLRTRGVTVVVVVGYGATRQVPGGPSANRRAVTGWRR